MLDSGVKLCFTGGMTRNHHLSKAEMSNLLRLLRRAVESGDFDSPRVMTVAELVAGLTDDIGSAGPGVSEALRDSEAILSGRFSR